MQRRAQNLMSVVLVLTAMMLVGLAGRVFYLERHVSAEALKKLAAQHTATISTMAGRSSIRAIDDTPLALSVRMYNLFADPAFIADPSGKMVERWKLEKELAKLPEGDPKIAELQKKMDKGLDEAAYVKKQAEEAQAILTEALAPLVNRPAEDLKWELDWNATFDNGAPRRFLWLAKEVDPEFYEKFMKLKVDLKDKARSLARTHDVEHAKVLAHALDGVGFMPSVRRVYPMGPLAGHIVGVTNIDAGLDGMEFQFDAMLRGRPGKMMVIKDAARRTISVEDQRFEPADDGRNVWLTIDTVVQGIAEEELQKTCEDFRAESGCVVVLDPHTGKIMAMAAWPAFNPAKPKEGRPEDRRDKNFDPYEPGSIFKPFIVAWALDKGLVKTTDVFNGGSGTWYDPTGRAVKDVHGCGVCTVPEVLIKSSNCCMAQMGWKMGTQNLYDAVHNFGFGQRTGVELPGDQKGMVHPYSQWNNGTKTSVSFGYEVAATPLQLVRAFGVLANGGWLVTPQVVHAAEDRPGHPVPWSELAGPPIERQIISEKTAATMREILEGVYGEHGTARNKGSKLYRLFAKTGTAHLAIAGAGHYAGDQYNSSFLVGGPVSSPRLVTVMAIHKPDRSLGHFGGVVAAPGATRLMERSLMYMHVAPDQMQLAKQ